jgi:hypothetical protein
MGDVCHSAMVAVVHHDGMMIMPVSDTSPHGVVLQ